MMSRIPPDSPAATMLVNRLSNALGCLRIASASEAPDSTSAAHLADDRLEGAVLLLVAEDLQALDERQAGVEHHRELAGEDGDALGADAARDGGSA